MARVGKHDYIRVEASALPSGLRWFAPRHWQKPTVEYSFATLGSSRSSVGADWMRVFERSTRATSYWQLATPDTATRGAKRKQPTAAAQRPGRKRESKEAFDQRLPAVRVSATMLAALRSVAAAEGVGVAMLVRRAIRGLLEHKQALGELPAEFVIHPRVVVSRKTGTVLLRSAESTKPTPALRHLMRDRE